MTHMLVSIKDEFPPLPDHCDIGVLFKGKLALIFYNDGTRKENHNYVSGNFNSSTELWCKMCGITPEETLVWILKVGFEMPHFYSDLHPEL